MLSAILSEKKYETKFITTATAKAIIMPFCPPKARPIIISSSVSAVSKNAVLKVFPITWLFPRIGCYAFPQDAKGLGRRELGEACDPGNSRICLAEEQESRNVLRYTAGKTNMQESEAPTDCFPSIRAGCLFHSCPPVLS